MSARSGISRRIGIFSLVFALNSGLMTVDSAALAAVPATNGPSVASWSDLADLGLNAPVVVHARIDRVKRLGGAEAAGVPPGQVRVLVQASLVAALRAPDMLPAQAEWLWQGLSPDGRHPPFAKGDSVIAFLDGGTPGKDARLYRLVSPYAQVPWSFEREASIRSILKEMLAVRASGVAVTGITDAFRTDGQVAGQSESQFFLSTDQRPWTLSVRRSPDAPTEVTIATGDMIDRGQPIAPDTIAWHALACGLPAQLPAALAEKEGLAADYAEALRSIGQCGRTVPPPA